MCDNVCVVEHIRVTRQGEKITRYLDKLRTEEKCCLFALKTIKKCVSFRNDLDEYFFKLDIVPKLVEIMESPAANDKKHILYHCVYIIA